MDRILFSRLAEPYGAFSNFYRRPFLYRSRERPTAEHAYQAYKFHDPTIRERIRVASSPTSAGRIGRARDMPLRPDWEALDPNPEPPAIERVKDRVMFEVCWEKFSQHADLRQLLLSTEQIEIVENSSGHGDAYWGETAPGVGHNKLGKVLMHVRERLRADTHQRSEANP